MLCHNSFLLYLLFPFYPKTSEEARQDEEDEFYNGEDYSYEYEVGSCNNKSVIDAPLEA